MENMIMITFSQKKINPAKGVLCKKPAFFYRSSKKQASGAVKTAAGSPRRAPRRGIARVICS